MDHIFNNRINCLSSCLTYILNSNGCNLTEEDMMDLNESVSMRSTFDTRMDESILSWMNSNLNFEIKNFSIDSIERYDLINLPIYSLRYKNLYETKIDIMHFVVVLKKVKNNIIVFDPYVPTVPLSTKITTLHVDDVDLNKTKILTNIILSENFERKNRIIKSKKLIFDESIWDNIKTKIINCNVEKYLELIFNLGSGSIEGSRTLMYKVFRDSFKFDAEKVSVVLNDWKKYWIILRMDLYKSYLSRNEIKENYLEHHIQKMKDCDYRFFYLINESSDKHDSRL